MHPRGVEIRFPGTHEGFARAFARLREALDAAGLDGAARYNVELVFEEIVANIVKHGAPDGHELEVRVTLQAGRDSMSLTFEDNGVSFDPRTAHPLPPRSLDDGRINAFDAATGALMGSVTDATGAALVVPNLHGLALGNQYAEQPATTLFFTAGAHDGARGWYGRLDFGPPFSAASPRRRAATAR